MSLLSLFHPMSPITAAELAAVLAEREVGILAGPNATLERHSKSISVAFNKLTAVSNSLEVLAKRVNGVAGPSGGAGQAGWAGGRGGERSGVGDQGSEGPGWEGHRGPSGHVRTEAGNEGIDEAGLNKDKVDQVVSVLVPELMSRLARELEGEAEKAVNIAFAKKLALLNQGLGKWQVSIWVLIAPTSDRAQTRMVTSFAYHG